MKATKEDIIARLRQDILGWEGFRPPQPGSAGSFGLGPLESAFPNGVFPIGAIHEFIRLCHPTETQIKKWQGDPPILWAWESYQVSTQLYAEVAAMKGRNIDNAYYEAHMPVIENRIEKAGIRLAGVLNELFRNAKPGEYEGNGAAATEVKPEKMEAAATIKIEDAPKHIGKPVKICGKVFGHKDLGNMALVNMGGAYPNQLLTLVLRDDAKQLADSLDNNQICVVGKLVDYKGKPEIMVTDSRQIEK